MPNPNPRTDQLPKLKRQDETSGDLASNPLCVRVETDIDEFVRGLPNKAAWLRRVITKAAIEEGDK